MLMTQRDDSSPPTLSTTDQEESSQRLMHLAAHFLRLRRNQCICSFPAALHPRYISVAATMTMSAQTVLSPMTQASPAKTKRQNLDTVANKNSKFTTQHLL